MAIQKNINSLASIEEAEAHFAGRLNNSPWKTSKTPVKEAALTTGTMLFNDMRWSGVAISESQPLAFPRIGQYFEPAQGRLVAFPSNTAPSRVLRGLFELVLHLIVNPDAMETGSTLEELTVGPVELKGLRFASSVPSHVVHIISPVLESRGASIWWRAN